MTVMELIARIGVKTDAKPAKDLLTTVKGLRIGFGAATIAAGALAAGLTKLVKSATAASRELAQFTRETGLSVEQLQKWQAVADQVSGSGNQIAGALKAITDNQAAIRLGEGNISAYSLLGINPLQDPFEILEQLRVKTSGLSQSMKANLLSQMGISTELLGTLELTNAQFREMASRAWVLTPEQISNNEKARASLARLSSQMKYLTGSVVAAISPAVQKFADIMGKFAIATSRAATYVTDLINKSERLQIILKMVAGGFGLKGLALMLSNPIGQITLAIVGLILVLEDLYVFSQGGDSLFGSMIEGVKNIANSIKDAFASAWDTFLADHPILRKLVNFLFPDTVKQEEGLLSVDNGKVIDNDTGTTMGDVEAFRGYAQDYITPYVYDERNGTVLDPTNYNVVGRVEGYEDSEANRHRRADQDGLMNMVKRGMYVAQENGIRAGAQNVFNDLLYSFSSGIKIPMVIPGWDHWNEFYADKRMGGQVQVTQNVNTTITNNGPITRDLVDLQAEKVAIKTQDALEAVPAGMGRVNI